LIFGTPEKKVDIRLGTWPSEESLANNGICSPKNKPSPDRNAEPARWREQNAKCAAKRDEEAPSIIKQEDNCKAAVPQSERIELMKIQLFTSTKR
jgi:hypothetical protein